MGDLVPLKSPQMERDTTAELGMTLALTAWVMAFATLFLVLGYLRVRAPLWPPAGAPGLPVVPAALNTAILLMSSAALSYGIRCIRRDDNVGLIRGLAGATALGAAFVCVQAFGWAEMAAAGLRSADHGAYAATYYTFTVFHAAHVVAGLVVLARLLQGAGRRRFNNAAHTSVRTGAMFWHFVDGMWVLTFLTMYVL